MFILREISFYEKKVVDPDMREGMIPQGNTMTVPEGVDTEL